MDSLLRSNARSTKPIVPGRIDARNCFKIKGRMIPREEFSGRLKNLCASLGFGPVTLCSAGLPAADFAEGGGSGQAKMAGGGNAVYVLSTKVAYNPGWGGFGGFPRLLKSEKNTPASGNTPTDFIAPFLHLYRFAQENIFLSRTGQGQYLITLPETLVQGSEGVSGCRLKLNLQRLVEPAGDGTFCPLAISGTLHSFAVSADFRQSVAILTADWQRGTKLSIGQYLDRELFSFADALGAVDSASPYVATLLPHLAEIVTHPTPNLRAAEIHLQQVFERDMAKLLSARKMNSRNLLYIAGLDIDMTAFTGQEEHYFVPWQAYISRNGKIFEEEYSLAQDDLFVQLLQQDAQCLE